MVASHSEKPTPFLIISLFLLALVNMQDGFDILAISYAAHSISEDWGITRSELGIVFSAGLFGMMLGAIFLAPLADKFGRKAITVSGLFLSGIGMLIAMVAPDLKILVAGRILTGLGVGSILASLNTLVSEYAGSKYRVAAVSIFQLGFSLGAFISGFLALWLLDIGSWRYIFAFGAFTSFVFIPVIMMLPESTAYLASKGDRNALSKINKIREKFGRLPLSEIPQVLTAEKQSFLGSLKTLAGGAYFLKTILIWTAFFLLLTTLYFLVTWMPKIIVDLGFSEADGNRGGRLINLYGMVGIVVIGILGYRVRPALITSIYLTCLALLLILFGRFGTNLSSILIMVSLIGVFVHGSMIGLYATVPSLYPTHLRATGTGWAIGISRLGAVLGPTLAGFLFDAGWGAQDIFKLYALPAGLASLVAFGLWWVQRRQNNDATTFLD